MQVCPFRDTKGVGAFVSKHVKYWIMWGSQANVGKTNNLYIEAWRDDN